MTWLVFISTFVTLVVIHQLTRPDPLNDIPGPWLAKYTSLLLAYHTRTGKRYLFVDHLHKKHGPFVRLTPTLVSCASPSAPSIIYAQGSLSLPKSSFYRAFYVDGTPSLFSTQDRAGHAQKRRVLAHPFSAASVRGLEPWIRIRMEKMIQGLDARCVGLALGAETPGRAGGGGGYVDILMWLNFLTFDVISDLAFGRPLGMLDRESDVLRIGDGQHIDDASSRTAGDEDEDGVASMIDLRGRTAAFLGLFPLCLPGSWLSPFVRYIPDNFIRRGLQGTEALSEIATRCVTDRLLNGTKGERGDLLDRLVSQRDSKGEEVTEEDIVTDAMLLLTAGSDTTANSTAAIIFHVLRNPRVLHKLRAELDDALAVPLDGNRSAESVVTYDEIKNLKYLTATIDEGFRMFATNAFGLPRLIPEGTSVVVGERVFGEGIELSAPAYTIQHDPAIWGDPEVFRPERWIDDLNCTDIHRGMDHTDKKSPLSPSELKKYLLTFGMGPRACIGKNLALLQIQILLSTLLSRYDLELRDDELNSVEGFMHKPVDVWVKIQRRRATLN
ncbi:cytochrome P450 [Hysterangium stoloniferum]|nr:cytochrome P450 [Hysterangium stoloniferum]